MKYELKLSSVSSNGNYYSMKKNRTKILLCIGYFEIPKVTQLTICKMTQQDLVNKEMYFICKSVVIFNCDFMYHVTGRNKHNDFHHRIDCYSYVCPF